jgi:hypothetical protein
MRTREDWLVDQLDRNDLTPALRAKYETELEAHAERHERAQEAKKLAEQVEIARKAEIRAMLLKNDIDLVAHLGEQEFGDDYEIVLEGTEHVVYSKVARDDQNHRRPHKTREAAEHDLRYLFYNRLYSKYVRTGDVDGLGELAS